MKKIILPFLIFLSLLAPAVAFLLSCWMQVPYGKLFFIFILAHTTLRLWETFLTSKEDRKLVLEQDWSLVLVTAIYIGFFYMVIWEFYVMARTPNLYISFLGLIVYFTALRVRLLSMNVLGKQWAIHAVGETRIQQRRLIKIGPYRYIRHPIYVATIMEQFSMLLLANAHYSILYFCLFTIWAYFWRMQVEDGNNEKIFGISYKCYKKEVGMFFPKIDIKPHAKERTPKSP